MTYVAEFLTRFLGTSGSGVETTLTGRGGLMGVGLICLNGLKPFGIVGSLEGTNCDSVLPDRLASLSMPLIWRS